MPNNVNTVEIERFITAVKQDPAQAKKTKSVEEVWNFTEGAPQFKTILKYPKGELSLTCELPPITGGWGGAPDPIQYCLWGLAACYAATFAASATSEGIILEELRVTAENKMNLQKQIGLSQSPIIEEVKFTVHAKSKAPRDKLARIKQLADERCPGVECITRPIPLKTELAS